MDQPELLSLIEQVYDAALDPARWAALAPVLAQTFGGESAVVQLQDRPRNLVTRLATTANYTPEANRAYATHFYKHDLWVAGGLMQPRFGAVLGEELVGDEVYFRSVIYNEFCRQLGIACLLGSAFPVEGGMIGIVGVHRPPGTERFDAPDKRRMELFLPHLRRALQVHARLGAAAIAGRAPLEALTALDSGVIVVDAQCRVLFANAPAEAILRTGCGLAAGRGALRPEDPRLRAPLEALVHAAATGDGDATGSGGVLALPRADGRQLSLLVSPFRIADGFGAPRPMALVFVSDPDRRPTLPAETFRRLYGLTGAEARLLVALLDGERLADYAGRNAVSMNTVRTQLKSVFAKTGTTRQAELVRSCLSDLVIRMAASRQTMP